MYDQIITHLKLSSTLTTALGDRFYIETAKQNAKYPNIVVKHSDTEESIRWGKRSKPVTDEYEIVLQTLDATQGKTLAEAIKNQLVGGPYSWTNHRVQLVKLQGVTNGEDEITPEKTVFTKTITLSIMWS